MPEAPAIRVTIYWHPRRKAWRVMAEHCGRIVICEDWDTEHRGAPAISDVRPLVNAMREEARSWLW